jgi:hypothetical protein
MKPHETALGGGTRGLTFTLKILQIYPNMDPDWVLNVLKAWGVLLK